MRLYHAIGPAPISVRVNRRADIHHAVKGTPVAVGRADLVLVFTLRAEWVGILDEGLDPHCRLKRVDRAQLRAQRVQEELQSGQALLAVDDDALLHLARWLLDLLQHHGAKKMRMVLLRRLAHDAVCKARYVVPQRLPLVLFIPDVRPLKQGNDKALRMHEHELRRADLGFH